MLYHCTHIVCCNLNFCFFLKLIWLGIFLSSTGSKFHLRAPWYNKLLSNGILFDGISVITGAVYILSGLISGFKYLAILLLGYIKFNIWVLRLFINSGIPQMVVLL